MKIGFLEGLPIGIGYFPIAMAFGLMARVTGLTLGEAIGFSSILYAGAAQFIGLSMIAIGVSFPEIVLATFFLNFRHFLMSATLSNRLTFDKWYKKLIIGHFVTDESFSVAAFTREPLSFPYTISMQITAFLGWNFGTIVGFVSGTVLPVVVADAMGIGLYAMFVALLIPECLKYHRGIILALVSGCINTLLILLGVSNGWSIIVSIVVVAMMNVVHEKKGRFSDVK